MPSPILPQRFADAVPSANADFCDRFTKWLAVPALLRDLFNWLLTPDGNISPAFQAEVSQYAAPTGSLMYALTLNVGDGWLLADGREVSREIYAALFAEIGTRYGDGNGTTTFTLPDLRGRSLIGAGASAAIPDFGEPALTNRNINDAYVGEETHSLTASENGEHMHGNGLLHNLNLTPNNTSAILRDQDDKSLSLYGSTATTVGSGAVIHGDGSYGNRVEINVGPSGNGAGHNNISPMLIAFAFVKI